MPVLKPCLFFCLYFFLGGGPFLGVDMNFLNLPPLMPPFFHLCRTFIIARNDTADCTWRAGVKTFTYDSDTSAGASVVTSVVTVLVAAIVIVFA